MESKIDSKIITLLNKFVDFDFNQFNQNHYIVLFIVFFIIAGLLKILNDYFIIRMRVQILSLYFKDLLNAFFLSDWHFFYMNDIGKISNSIYKELDKVGGSLIATLHIISNIFLISIIICIPFFISYQVTFFSLIAIIFLLTPVKLINLYFYKVGKKFTFESNVFSKMFFYGVTMYKNISANAGNSVTITEIYKSYKKINAFEIIKKILNSSTVEFLNTFSILFVFIIFGISKTYSLGFPEISAILYSFMRIFPHVNNSISMVNVIESCRPGYELIEDLKKESKKISKTWGKKNFNRVKENIKFKDVSFNYPNGKNALKNINLEIKTGEMVALVGQSGSGKSTILDMIAGLNTCSSGEILIDNQSLYNFDKNSFLKKIGYVDSDINLFPCSIKKNVMMFSPNATEKNLLDAYSFSNLNKVIADIENSSEKIINNRGSTFSSGQKQRLCIARALIKNPEIIIFDEATNYLDDKNEIFILENLKKLKGEKTIIFATHKKSILKYFDKVLHIKNGEISKIDI